MGHRDEVAPIGQVPRLDTAVPNRPTAHVPDLVSMISGESNDLPTSFARSIKSSSLGFGISPDVYQAHEICRGPGDALASRMYVGGPSGFSWEKSDQPGRRFT